MPLLCAHINFYVRLFVRVYTSPSLVKRAPTKRAYVYQCASCEAFALQPVARLAAHANGSDKIVAGAGPETVIVAVLFDCCVSADNAFLRSLD